MINVIMSQPVSPKVQTREPEKKYVQVKAYLLKELAVIYQVDRRTLAKWMKPFAEEIGKRIGYYYQVQQVRIIFQKLPLPHNVIVCDEYEA